MTQKSIVRQIEVIREVTAKAAVSKEAAIAFLARAGIKETPKKIHTGDSNENFVAGTVKEFNSKSGNQKSQGSLATRKVK